MGMGVGDTSGAEYLLQGFPPCLAGGFGIAFAVPEEIGWVFEVGEFDSSSAALGGRGT
jgi:hypothetical protein